MIYFKKEPLFRYITIFVSVSVRYRVDRENRCVLWNPTQTIDPINKNNVPKHFQLAAYNPFQSIRYIFRMLNEKIYILLRV